MEYGVISFDLNGSRQVVPNYAGTENEYKAPCQVFVLQIILGIK